MFHPLAIISASSVETAKHFHELDERIWLMTIVLYAIADVLCAVACVVIVHKKGRSIVFWGGLGRIAIVIVLPVLVFIPSRRTKAG